MSESVDPSAPAAGDPPSPYGTRPSRWIKPIVIAALLVALEEQGVIAFLFGVFLLFVYLPRTFAAKKYRVCRRDRLLRFAIYLAAVLMVFGLRLFGTNVARERAEQIIAGVQAYKSVNGKYPERLDQLVPKHLAEIPAKARPTLFDTGFRYIVREDRHDLMYVTMPPFGRRIFNFESGLWSDLD